MRDAFGRLPDGREVERLRLSSGDLTVSVLTLGAILQDLRLDGVGFGLTLGSPEAAAYAGPMAYWGAVVGPVANRVAGAEVEIDGTRHRLIANEGTTTLHGGKLGTHAHLWRVEDQSAESATLSLELPDGAEGWPGTRRLTARYRVVGAALELELEGRTDRPTFLNLAHHGYWRLSPGPDLAGHRLEIAADRYTPVDARKIPTGRIASVAGTEFDFRVPRPVGPGAGATYDHNFCLASARRPLAFACRLTGPTGLAMTVETTEPGLQIYDASRMEPVAFTEHSGAAPVRFAGLAIEPQCWPDAPHRPEFPRVRLDPGETYRQVTRWSFAA